MAETTYAFLDLTGLAALRTKVLATEAAIVFDETLSRALWANAAGAQLFGGDGIVMLTASRLNSGQPFVRQLRDAARQIVDDEPITRGFRIVKGLRTEFIQCELAWLALPDGARAILLTCADETMFRRKREHDLAEDAVAALEGVAQAAAILDEYGLPIAASDSFAAIDIAADDLEAAIADAQSLGEPVARLRSVAEDGLPYSLGLARLRAHPGRYLLLVDPAEEEAAQAAEAAALAAMPLPTDLPDEEEDVQEPQLEIEPETVAFAPVFVPDQDQGEDAEPAEEEAELPHQDDAAGDAAPEAEAPAAGHHEPESEPEPEQVEAAPEAAAIEAGPAPATYDEGPAEQSDLAAFYYSDPDQGVAEPGTPAEPLASEPVASDEAAPEPVTLEASEAPIGQEAPAEQDASTEPEASAEQTAPAAPVAPAGRKHGSIRALLESWYLRDAQTDNRTGTAATPAEASGAGDEASGAQEQLTDSSVEEPAASDETSVDAPAVDDGLAAEDAFLTEPERGEADAGVAEPAMEETAPDEAAAFDTGVDSGEVSIAELEGEADGEKAQADEDEDFAEDFDARAAIEGGWKWPAAPVIAAEESEDAAEPTADDAGPAASDQADLPAVEEPEQETPAADEQVYEEVVSAGAEEPSIAEETPDDGQSGAGAETIEPEASETGDSEEYQDAEPSDGFVFVSSDHPVRFAWTVDDAQIFRSVSPDLAKALGPNAADVVGRRWSDVARVFGFDRGGDIQRLLEKRDTWSGKTVLWPVQGTDLAVPVDLAALPAFSGSRTFDGFRGFGIIRTADAIVDPDETGLALVSGPMENNGHTGEDDDSEEALSAATERRVMFGARLQEDRTDEEPGAGRRGPAGESGPGGNVVELTSRKRDRQDELSNREVRAFQEIGRKLGTDEIAAGFAGRETFRNPARGPVADEGRDEALNWAEEEAAETDEAELEWRDDAVSGQDEREYTQDTSSQTGPEDEEQDAGKPDIGPLAHSAGETTASILKRLPIPVLVYRSGETLYANPELLAISGYNSVEDLARAGGIDALFAASGIYEGENATMTLKRRDGGGVSVSPLLQSVPWEGEKALLLTFRQPQPVAQPVDDKVALDQARIVELNNILDTATDGIVIASNDGIVESLNGPAQALFGRGADEMSGRPLTELFAPESHRGIHEYMREVSEPGIAGLLNDGREAIGLEAKGGLIPLFVTLGRTGGGKFCAVLRDITQWKKAEEDLVSARRMAETASEQKSEFLARVSHEIRTPLNAIIGFSDVMIEERFGPIGNDRYRGYLRDINRSGIHVLDLINDLLDISKIEAGKMELTYEAVDLNQLVTETVALLQPQANGERIIIRTSLSRAVPRVVADARSIRQIVLNLVSNAIKFTPANGQVIVSTVYEGNGEVVLRVRDTGMGMNEREIEHAMKPFHQVHVTQDKRGQGTGLGLPLTKALVEANRAYFDLESTPGEGTIAHVHFPTQRVLAD